MMRKICIALIILLLACGQDQQPETNSSIVQTALTVNDNVDQRQGEEAAMATLMKQEACIVGSEREPYVPALPPPRSVWAQPCPKEAAEHTEWRELVASKSRRKSEQTIVLQDASALRSELQSQDAVRAAEFLQTFEGDRAYFDSLPEDQREIEYGRYKAAFMSKLR